MGRLEGVKSVDFPKGQVATVKVAASASVKGSALAAAIVEPFSAESLELDFTGAAAINDKETITLKGKSDLTFEVVKAASGKKDEKERAEEQAKLDATFAAFVKAVKGATKRFKVTGGVSLKKDGVVELRSFEALKEGE